MRILLLGATGRTGRLIADRLIADGHHLTCAGRRKPEIAGIAFQDIDLGQADQVRLAVQGKDVVISALASGKGNPVCSSVAKAVAGVEGLRFLTIGGAGVDAAGDRKSGGDKFIGWVMRRVAGEMLADRQAELAILQASRLRWTMLRPPRLTDKPATGTYQVTLDRPASTAISRADLAKATCDMIALTKHHSQAPFVSG